MLFSKKSNWALTILFLLGVLMSFLMILASLFYSGYRIEQALNDSDLLLKSKDNQLKILTDSLVEIKNRGTNNDSIALESRELYQRNLILTHDSLTYKTHLSRLIDETGFLKSKLMSCQSAKVEEIHNYENKIDSIHNLDSILCIHKQQLIQESISKYKFGSQNEKQPNLIDSILLEKKGELLVGGPSHAFTFYNGIHSIIDTLELKCVLYNHKHHEVLFAVKHPNHPPVFFLQNLDKFSKKNNDDQKILNYKIYIEIKNVTIQPQTKRYLSRKKNWDKSNKLISYKITVRELH